MRFWDLKNFREHEGERTLERGVGERGNESGGEKEGLGMKTGRGGNEDRERESQRIRG